MELDIISIFVRWGHVLFGIAWIGILYYFNFIQGGYFKAASPEGLADAKAKLAPEALWWFRWAAMFTFITGLYLLMGLAGNKQMNPLIIAGATMGILMFLNVWLIIWPNQKIALGMVEGDAAAAGGKALLASRTNTLFSAPMLFGMLGGPHFASSGLGYGSAMTSTALYVVLALIVILEINAIVGKQGPMTTVRGVIMSSLGLTVVMGAIFALV
ncbi:MAG: antitermination protein NusG [Gammaproteobacteria bacterium]|nr:MAG: antitermination protein NusG [Gammaproteobacteria bacterium]